MILLLIFLISFAGAILCSRIMVRHVLEILANSLNVMAKRLDDAMKELEGANQKLKEDMEHITELSRQRRDFFAAASRELKTPITILKGQIESMERLVKEILTISKIEMDGLAGKAESVPDAVTKVTETLLLLARE